MLFDMTFVTFTLFVNLWFEWQKKLVTILGAGSVDIFLVYCDYSCSKESNDKLTFFHNHQCFFKCNSEESCVDKEEDFSCS
jgi:hypothetical protein